MSQIDVRARHHMSRDDAQAAADELACDLAKKFDIDYGWEGDHIHFERSGVHGVITVREREIRIRITSYNVCYTKLLRKMRVPTG